MTSRESILWRDVRRSERFLCATVPLQMVEKLRRAILAKYRREEACRWSLPLPLVTGRRKSLRDSTFFEYSSVTCSRENTGEIFIAIVGRHGANLSALIERTLSASYLARIPRISSRYLFIRKPRARNLYCRIITRRPMRVRRGRNARCKTISRDPGNCFCLPMEYGTTLAPRASICSKR